MCIVILSSLNLFGQELKSEKLGKASAFIKELRLTNSLSNLKQLQTRKKNKPFKLDKEGRLTSDIKLFSNNERKEIFSGKITGEKNSNVILEVRDNNISGTVTLFDMKKAYKYNTTVDGEVILEETDINKVTCIGLEKPSKKPLEISKPSSSKKLRMPPLNVSALHSNIGAPATIYLDFDGELVVSPAWNGGQPIDAQSQPFTAEEIYVIWSIVAEDFAPFNIDVTTDRPYYDSKPYGTKHMNIFTNTNTAAPGTGGVAYVGTFISDFFCPSWSFNIGAKAGGETASHEIGHALGLFHDGTSAYQYFDGHTNWGPIMGAPFGMEITQWSKGEYQNASNPQDDLAVIASPTNKFGYKTDDYGNTIETASLLNYLSIEGNIGTVNHRDGLIAKNTDVDVFRFQTNGGTVNLSIKPAYPQYGIPTANLNIKAQLLNSAGNVLMTSDVAGLSANIDYTLSSGTYYLKVEGVGSDNPLTNGFSDYGSIGVYNIGGTIPNPVTGQFIGNISYPENNSELVNPGTVRIKTNIASPTTVTLVEYYDGNIKIGQSASAQSGHYLDIANISDGQHVMHLVITNSTGQKITSAPVTFTVYKNLTPDSNTSNKFFGLVYDYYEGSYPSLPNFSTLTPVYRGIADAINLTDIPVRSDNFAIRYTGYLQIYQESLYKLSLNSDDGSKLYMGNKLIINNDGNHPMTEVSGKVALSPGYYPITIEYFEAVGGQDIIFSIHDELSNYSVFPSLFHDDIIPKSAVYPQNRLSPGVSFEYNEGFYTALPNFNNLTYKSKGILQNFNLSIPNRSADYFAVRYTAYLDIVHTGLYNFFTNSDDGTKLYIDDIPVVLNDGSHGMIEKSGSIWLGGGKHNIRVEYFELHSGEGLTVSYSGPGVYKKEIPTSVLSRNPVTGEQVSYYNYLQIIPGVVSAEFYDQGGEGYAYHDNSAGNKFNTLRADGVDILEYSNIRFPDYVISDIQDGEWVEYTVDVTQSGPVNFHIYCSTGNGTSKLHLEKDNVAITPVVNIPVITDGSTFQIVPINNINMTKGEQIIRVYFDKGGFMLDYIYSHDATTARQDLTINSSEASASSIVAFPNPFEEYVNIDLSQFDSVNEVRVLNLNGSSIFEFKGEELSKELLMFNQNIPSGLYILEVVSDSHIVHSTIVKN